VAIHSIIDAMRAGDHQAAERFLKEPGDADTFWEGASALAHAAQAGDERMVRLLLEHGAKPDWQPPPGFFDGYFNITKSERKHYKEKNERVTPLIAAVLAGSESIVKLLLDHGADVDACLAGWTGSYESRRNPLEWAAYEGHVGMVRELLRRGAQTVGTGPNGESAMHYAAETGHADVLEVLLEHGCKVTPKGKHLDAPLHLAVSSEDVRSVLVLLQHRANPSICRSPGTPLHMAARGDDQEIAKLLLENGADVNAKHLESTPLDEAISRGNSDMAKLLRQHGGKRGSTSPVVVLIVALAVVAALVAAYFLLLR